MSVIPVLITLCAFAGFSLATFIYFKKKKPKPLVCPIGHSCDPVVHSDYSRFLGIPVEILGILYYLVVFSTYLLLSLSPDIKTAGLEIGLLATSSIAFLFSAYLTGVQAFILKEWCTWCLISATLCVIILIAALQLSGIEITNLLGALEIRN